MNGNDKKILNLSRCEVDRVGGVIDCGRGCPIREERGMCEGRGVGEVV